MSILRPFKALRPVPERVAAVAAVPYDVVNREEAAHLAKENPLSFLHVSRSEIDLPLSTDPYSETVYNKAKENFDDLVEECPLIQEETPSLYVYHLIQDGHEQTGIAATFSIDEYDHGLIRKHEKTRQDKEDDRTRHLLALNAQTGPVFLTYRGLPGINKIVEETKGHQPLYDFEAADGVRHMIWRIADTAALTALFSQVSSLYIADGHHRAASASRVRAELAARNPMHTGKEPYNFVLAVAFPCEQLRILPYYRVLKDLNGRSAAELLDLLSSRFDINPKASSPELKRHEFGLYLNQRENQWHHLTLKKQFLPNASDPIADLDVSILQEQVLRPLFDIKDPRTDKRIDFVGGIRGTGELERLVQNGEAKAAFSLYPTTLNELLAVSDIGGIMPPKSTWFEPKLRDGILSHLLK